MLIGIRRLTWSCSCNIARDILYTQSQRSHKKAAKPKIQVARLPSKLVVGAWVTVEDAVSRHARPSRLHYVSPRKSHYLFVDRQGNKVFECSRTMLARRIKLGEVVMLDGEPDASLFDRILETLFGKAKKGTGHGAPAGALAPA